MIETYSFGEWISRRRKTLDLTQRDLAERSNCTLSTIKKLETDERRPSRDLAHLLADALRISPEWRATFVECARGMRPVDALSPMEADGEQRAAPAVSITPHLPPQTTPFIGREQALAELAGLLNDPNARLITILAPGGMGKTRLSLEAARSQIGRYMDGVVFVPLAPLTSAADIVTTIAENIGFSFYGEYTPAQQLINFLQDRAMLLVLDNFEHLLDSTPLVAAMMQSAPGVRVLITSRERLNLQGEIVYTLRGLEFPTWEAPEDVLDYDAVKLFMQSARRVRPDFVFEPDHLDYLALICRLTEGMPLGIELAAGWVDVLSLEQIAVELQQGIDILETDLRDVPDRQRSIHATFEYTWRRLTDTERTILGRLSVFRGGFTLPAAQAVAGATARHLRGLAQKSLIQTESGERFSIHELLRQFAAGKLAEADELLTIQIRHAAFFADFMQERRSELFTHQQFDALVQIEADFENVRAAWNVLVNQQAFDELPKFLDSFWFFFVVRTRGQEGVELFEPTANALQSLPTSDLTELTLACVWARLAWFYNDVGLHEKAKVTTEDAIRLLNRHDSPEDLLAAYRSLSVISLFRKDRETVRQVGEAGYELARKLGNRSHEAHSLLYLGIAASMFNDDLATVLRLVREARAIYEDLGDQWGIMESYTTEASSHFQTGDYESAKYAKERHQALAKAFGSAFHVADSALFHGVMALWEGDYGKAGNLLRQSLRTLWNAGYAHYALAPVLFIAQLLVRENKIEAAVELLALIDRHPGHHPLFDLGPDAIGKLSEELKAKLDSNRFAAAWARGHQRELSAIVAELLDEC
jgi:predicted ATPase/transcriptional regulator with XRE-family HTH domain